MVISMRRTQYERVIKNTSGYITDEFFKLFISVSNTQWTVSNKVFRSFVVSPVKSNISLIEIFAYFKYHDVWDSKKC